MLGSTRGRGHCAWLSLALVVLIHPRQETYRALAVPIERRLVERRVFRRRPWPQLGKGGSPRTARRYPSQSSAPSRIEIPSSPTLSSEDSSPESVAAKMHALPGQIPTAKGLHADANRSATWTQATKAQVLQMMTMPPARLLALLSKVAPPR